MNKFAVVGLVRGYEGNIEKYDSLLKEINLYMNKLVNHQISHMT